MTFSGGIVGAFGGTGAATADVGVLGGFKTANGGMGNAGGPGGISLTGSGMTGECWCYSSICLHP